MATPRHAPALEPVDVLEPPDFERTGVVKTLEQAWHDEEWIGTFNLWIVRAEPEPAIVYQVRSPQSTWAPGKLDVSAGGHYRAGEGLLDGLREVEEELGKRYDVEGVVHLGRRLNVSQDVLGRRRRNVVDVFLVRDDAPLDSYVLQPSEVFAVAACPLDELERAHADAEWRFGVEALTAEGGRVQLTVGRSSFPENADDYHARVVRLARGFLQGEPNLRYAD